MADSKLSPQVQAGMFLQLKQNKSYVAAVTGERKPEEELKREEGSMGRRRD